MCTFGLSGCRGRRGQPENSEQTPPKFHGKTSKRRRKKENCGGRGQKSAKFWASHPSGPCFCPPWGRIGLSQKNLFWPKSKKAPLSSLPSRIGVSLSRMGLNRANSGMDQNWSGSKMVWAKSGRTKSGRAKGGRAKSGKMSGPKVVWAKSGIWVLVPSIAFRGGEGRPRLFALTSLGERLGLTIAIATTPICFLATH